VLCRTVTHAARRRFSAVATREARPACGLLVSLRVARPWGVIRHENSTNRLTPKKNGLHSGELLRLILNIASGVYVRYWRTKVKSSEPLAVDFGLSVSIRQPAAGLCPLASQLQSRSGVGPVCVTNLAHLRLLPVPAESVMTLTRCFHGEQRIVGKRACRFSPAEVFGPRGGWSAVLGVLRAVDCPRRISLLRLAGRGGYGPLRLGQSLCIAHVAGWITRALQLRPKLTAASLRPADGHRSGGHGSLSRLERQLLHLCRGALHAPLALLAFGGRRRHDRSAGPRISRRGRRLPRRDRPGQFQASPRLDHAALQPDRLAPRSTRAADTGGVSLSLGKRRRSEWQLRDQLHQGRPRLALRICNRLEHRCRGGARADHRGPRRRWCPGGGWQCGSPAAAASPSACGGRGFTLVELLVVIAIIGAGRPPAARSA